MAKRKGLYSSLARAALRKNMRIYLPYLLACTGTVMMFNLLLSLALDKNVAGIRGGANVQAVLTLGSVVVAIFSMILLFYTNSVIIRNRKKEFGLYNILGMEKKHVGVVLLWETLYTALISLILGLIFGFVFSKLAQLLLGRILGASVDLRLRFQPLAAIITLGLFLYIFLFTLIKNLTVIFRARPVELLHSENVGEREPKSRWLLAILGVALLGAGYVMALRVKDSYSAITLFFIAVICVILGTYLLFTAFSIVFLKALKKNGRYYYRTNHFVSVSGMLYRMKRNAAGLASICVLSTMVLVTVSTTFSLFIGLDGIMEARYPREVMYDQFHEDSTPEEREAQRDMLRARAEEYGLAVDNELAYTKLSFFSALGKDGKTLIFDSSSPEVGALLEMNVLTLDDYNRLTGSALALESDGACYWSPTDIHINELHIDDMRLALYRLDSFPLTSNPVMLTDKSDLFLVVKGARERDAIYDIQLAHYGKNASKLRDEGSFDLIGDKDAILDYERSIQAYVREHDFHGLSSFGGRQLDYESEYASTYGAMFFLGMFMGLLFVMTCVTIMYYKQVSEGMEDRARYEIMQKVGMTRSEVRSAIRSQVLTVFFLPLIAAGIHVAFAFPMVTYILRAFGLIDTALFARCTLGCYGGFALLYIAVYLLTARSYYRIVDGRQ